MLKKLISHTAIYGLAPYVGQALGLIILPFITPFLTAEDYGVWGILIAIQSGMVPLRLIGTPIILWNSFIKHSRHYKLIWGHLVSVLWLWSFFFVLIQGVVFVAVLPIPASDAFWVVLFVSIPTILFGPLGLVGPLYFNALEKPVPVSVITVFAGVANLIVSYWFIRIEQMGFWGWIYGLCVGEFIIGAIYAYIFIGEKFPLGIKPRWAFLRSRLTTSIPIMFHNYAGYVLDSFDRVVMAFLGISTANIGLYSVANLFPNVGKGVVGASAYVVNPIMLKAYRDGEERIPPALINLLFSITLTIAIVSGLWMKEILQIFIPNRSLTGAYVLAGILMVGYSYRPMYYLATAKLFFREKSKPILYVTGVAALLNLVLNFVLIPFFGYEIAAYTTVFSFLYMGFAGFYLPVVKSESQTNYRAWRPLIMILLGLCIVYLTIDLDIKVKIFISLGVLLIGGWLIWKSNKKIMLVEKSN